MVHIMHDDNGTSLLPHIKVTHCRLDITIHPDTLLYISSSSEKNTSHSRARTVACSAIVANITSDTRTVGDQWCTCRGHRIRRAWWLHVATTIVVRLYWYDMDIVLLECLLQCQSSWLVVACGGAYWARRGWCAAWTQRATWTHYYIHTCVSWPVPML